jgi:hypothetical protein
MNGTAKGEQLTMKRKDAVIVLKHLRDVVGGQAMAIREGWDDVQNPVLQACFMESVEQGALVLDLYLTKRIGEQTEDPQKTLASFCIGGRQAWARRLSDGTSYLMLRFPTPADPRCVYMDSRMEVGLADESTLKRWKAIDKDAKSTLFTEPR